MPEKPPPEWRPEDRPRLRPAIEFTPVVQRGVPKVVLSDPANPGSNYFQCPADVAEVLRLFDGSRTIEDVAGDASRLLDDDVGVADLAKLLDQAWGYGFVEGSAPLARDPSRWRRILAFQLVEFQSGERFERFARLFAPLFTRRAAPYVATFFVLLLVTFVYLFTQFWFAVGIGLQQMVSLKTFVFYYAAFFLMVALHESGHAIAFVNLGGRRPRFGLSVFAFLFLAFYTDVTDSYRFSSKWKRIAVSMGGLAVNLLVSVPTIIAWTHATGKAAVYLFYFMAVNMIAVLLSIFPTFRSDVYYAAASFFETPNLHGKSVRYLGGKIRRAFGGRPSSVRPDGPSQATLFVVYAIASTLAMGMAYYGLVVQITAASPAAPYLSQTPLIEIPGASQVYADWSAQRAAYDAQAPHPGPPPDPCGPGATGNTTSGGNASATNASAC